MGMPRSLEGQNAPFRQTSAVALTGASELGPDLTDDIFMAVMTERWRS